MSVTAKDKGTGKEQAIKITAKSGLTEAEIKRMVQEAEQNAESDKAKRELVTARNNLDNLIYQNEKLITDSKDKIKAEDVKDLEAEIKEAKDVLAKSADDLNKINTAQEKLTSVAQKVSATLYEAQKTQGGAPGAESSEKSSGGSKPGSDDGDVIDADFKDVN